MEGNPMNTVPDGAVAVTLSLAARRGGGFLLVEIDRQFFDEMINRFNNNNIKTDRGTPLTDKGYVDWNKMLVLLRQKNLL